MTDIYVSYAREDRERVRPLGDMLRELGWDVWMDVSDRGADHDPAKDQKLARAGAILVIWSEHARRSEHVRSEAATGLYKNKLVQVRLEGGAPPRPFDQIDALDFARWSGQQDAPEWRRLVSVLRTAAGEPVVTRQAGRKSDAPRMAEPPPPPRGPAMTLSQPLEPPPRPTPPPPPPPQPPMPEDRGVSIRWSGPVDLPPAPPAPPVPEYRAPEPRAPEPEYSFNMRSPEPTPPAPQLRSRIMEEPPPPVRREKRPSFEQLSESVYRRPDDGGMDRLPHADLGISSAGYRGKAGGGGWAGPVMVVAAVALIGSGVGIWMGDPFGWRAAAAGGESEPVAMAARSLGEAPIANGEPAAGTFEDTEEAAADWRRVDQKNPDALRDHAAAYPRTSTAQQARAALRVMDAQAWVTAVTADSETAYRTYLASFPADAAPAGAMAGLARDRLTELGAERSQAIEDIQRGLTALELYDGMPTGQADADLTLAVQRYAASKRKPAPALATAPPRDLRTFAELVRSGGAAPRASAAAAEADRQRLAQAQAASAAATVAAKETAAVLGTSGADTLAMSQQRRLEQAEAWAIAERAGTVAGYQAYLSAYPEGSNASDARAELARLNKPAPFSIDQLAENVKAAVETARRAQSTANTRAAAARQAAASADALTDASTITGAGGDRFTAQIFNGAPNGLGTRVRGSGVNAGDKYRGELRNGQAYGVGVYEFADNPSNASARASRYEGEHAADAASGHGVMHWRDGDTFAGQGAGSSGQARGVLTYPNGLRYEGEMSAGQRSGLGVVWGTEGNVMQAGRWSRDELVEPMGR